MITYMKENVFVVHVKYNQHYVDRLIIPVDNMYEKKEMKMFSVHFIFTRLR